MTCITEAHRLVVLQDTLTITIADGTILVTWTHLGACGTSIVFMAFTSGSLSLVVTLSMTRADLAS